MSVRDLAILLLIARLGQERFAVFGRVDDEGADIIDELLEILQLGGAA